VVHARHVVLAAGAWSALAPGVQELLGLTLDDVHPVKGHIVELAPVGGVDLDRVVYGACYLVPRADGRLVCGSNMERAGFDTAVRDDPIGSRA
jgi:glycine oxidase